MEKPTEAELLSEVLTEVHLMCRRKFMRGRREVTLTTDVLYPKCNGVYWQTIFQAAPF